MVAEAHRVQCEGARPSISGEDLESGSFCVQRQGPLCLQCMAVGEL